MTIINYVTGQISGLINQVFWPNYACNEPLIKEWEEWAQQGKSGENRTRAVEELTRCLHQNSKKLSLSNLGLTSLPAHFPPEIESLDVSSNRLTQLPTLTELPLKWLEASHNRLSTLPDGLPASLLYLFVEGNQLKQLPSQLPFFLKFLFANSNQLASLPETLPLTLQLLIVMRNQLDVLPTRLPINLIHLDATGNQLEQLPALPEGLVRLDVSYNRLAALPDPLPPRLLFLYADSNQLTHLPVRLPDCLEHLCVNDNALKSLPEVPPFSLQLFRCNGNPLESFFANIQNKDIPLQPFQDRIQNSEIQSQVSDFTTQLEPWAAIGKEVYVNDFALFLKKLQAGSNNQYSPILKQRVGAWLDYIARKKGKALRANTFLIAREARTSGVDRTSLFYFNKMYRLMLDDQLIKTDTPVVKLFNTNLMLFRLQQVEKMVTQRAATRGGSSRGFAEEIKIYLAYECLLCNKLSLRKFSEIAGLTRGDLRWAKNDIKQQEKVNFIGYLINESASWQARLTQWDRHAVESVEEGHLDFIASEHFNQEVNQALMKNRIDIHHADAHREVSTELAKKSHHKLRYQLTKDFLAAHDALALLDRFEEISPKPISPDHSNKRKRARTRKAR